MGVTLGTTRDGFGLGLKAAAAHDDRIVALCADLTESMRLEWFRDAFPQRFIEVGVAEQNLVGLAAGLALQGKIPFAASYAVFSPGNSWGVIRTSVCYSNLNVKIVGGHAGLTTGPDGATHQALEDIAIMQVLPNMTVVVPADQEEAQKATRAVALHQGPCYLRVGKFPVPTVTTSTLFEIGKAVQLRDGIDATIIACGTMVATALTAAQRLHESGLTVRVLNMHTIKPIDVAAILAAAQQTKAIVSIEEHQVTGGLGSAIAQTLATHQEHVPFAILGVADTFGQSGKPEELLTKYGLTSEHLVATLQKLLKK